MGPLIWMLLDKTVVFMFCTVIARRSRQISPGREVWNRNQWFRAGSSPVRAWSR